MQNTARFVIGKKKKNQQRSVKNPLLTGCHGQGSPSKKKMVIEEKWLVESLENCMGAKREWIGGEISSAG